MFMTATRHPNGQAPVTVAGPVTGRTFQLGAKGGRTAQAWEWIWDQLSRTEWSYGSGLAEEAAQRFDVKPISITVLLGRMHTAGFLERTTKPIETTYRRGAGPGYIAKRNRAHYRIATEQPADGN